MVKSVSSVNLVNKIIAPRKKSYSFARDLINNSGAFLQDDILRVKSVQTTYSGLSKVEIKNKLAELTNSVNNLLQNFFSETHSVSNCIIYNNSQIASREICKKLKSYRLKETVLKGLLLDENPQNIVLYPTDIEVPLIESINKKNIPFVTSESLVEHPRNIAAKIVGYQYSEENPIKDKKNIIYKKANVSSLIKEQEQILSKITSIIVNKGVKQDFVYTNDEIKFLRNLIKKYDENNSILLKNGIDIKNLENLQYFSKFPSDIKAGTIMPNSDIVIDTVRIMDLELNKKIPAVITYSNTNLGHRFKIYRYDRSLIEQNDKIQELKKKYILNNQFDKLSSLNEKCKKLFEQDEIAEVFMECKNKDDIRENFSDKDLLSDEKLNELWEGGEKYIFIRNLKNYNEKRYCSTAFPLIKILKNIVENNKLKNVFINAYAYNNVKHSPAALYLRAGCIPISHTEEEIFNMLKSEGKGYDKPVIFIYKTKNNP